MAEIENLKIGNGGTLHIVGNEDIVANAWQAGKTYVKNRSYVIREHRLYVCNVTHTSVEPFAATKWTEITIGDAIGNNIGDLSQLTTTDKSSLVGAVNEIVTNKADKTLINDIIKIKYFALPAASVTQNMDLSSNVSLDSGYKFLCYMPSILPDGFTTDQYLWISAPGSKAGNPWWKTNPISGAGTGAKLRFFYLEIKDIS